jgi:hypothetical protein
LHTWGWEFLNLVSQVRVLPGAVASSCLLLHTVCCKFVREFIVSCDTVCCKFVREFIVSAVHGFTTGKKWVRGCVAARYILIVPALVRLTSIVTQ